jgi:hypothetical protein
MFAILLFLINNYMLGLTGHGFISDTDHMFLAILCESIFEVTFAIWLTEKHKERENDYD